MSTNKEPVEHKGDTFYRDCIFKAKTGRYAEFRLLKTKLLSSYAGLSGCQPTRNFTHISRMYRGKKLLIHSIFYLFDQVDLEKIKS